MMRIKLILRLLPAQIISISGVGNNGGMRQNRGMNQCPYCHADDRQVKNGKNPSGSVRLRCQHCGRKYTPEPTLHGYPETLRQQAVKLSLDGMNYRRIARQLKVDHKSVMNWVKAYADQLPAAALPVEQPLHVVEMDELYTFVGKKRIGSTW